MQLAILPCDGVELLSYEPLTLQAHIQTSHWGCQLVLHYLHPKTWPVSVQVSWHTFAAASTTEVLLRLM